MIKRIVVILSTLLFAFLILFISVLRTASVKYSFSDIKANSFYEDTQSSEGTKIDYYLVYPGPVLPDHPLWTVKALRDRLWLSITTNPSRKAELMLLFADKRLGAAKILFERKKYELGYTTLTKAEKYLESACVMEETLRKSGTDTNEFLLRLVNASLKHRQIMEQLEILSPDDVKPKINESKNFVKNVYVSKSLILVNKGIPVPINPFN